MDINQQLIDKLKTVFDPEFPLVDIWTMWLIYDLKIDEKSESITVIMSFTTPTCPMADTLIEMVKNAVLEAFPQRQVNVEITFDPMRTPSKIRDPDLQRMFM